MSLYSEIAASLVKMAQERGGAVTQQTAPACIMSEHEMTEAQDSVLDYAIAHKEATE